VFEYHFTALPGRLDVGRIAAALDRLAAGPGPGMTDLDLKAKQAQEAQEQAALAAAEALFEPVPGEAASEAEAAGDATA